MYQDFCFRDDDTGMSTLQELHLALMMSDVDEVQRLIAIADVNAVDAGSRAAIHHAALGTSVEAMLLLLESGANVHALTATGATALHISAFNGRVAICKLLVMHDADLRAEDCNGHTPLYDATYMSSTGSCPCAADVPERQPGRVAAFLRATQQMRDAERKAFVRRSWQLDVSQMLQDALEQRDAPTRLARLLTHYRRDVDARDYDGSTALHAAVQTRAVEAARLLLDHGAAVDARTNCGETALHLAAREGHLPAVELLVTRGASLRAATLAGCTPLDEAQKRCSGGSGRVRAYLEAIMRDADTGGETRCSGGDSTRCEPRRAASAAPEGMTDAVGAKRQRT